MIDGLRPYAQVKPSGLPSLGDVPAQWDVRRNGRLFGSRRETGFPDLPVLEVSLRSGVRVRDFESGTRKQEMGDRSKYQRAMRGDIAYNMMRMWQGAVGIAPVDGLVSPAYVVARPFVKTDPAYYAYLFRTAAYMREVDTFSRGIVPDRNRLYWESFKQMPSVYPPLDEQRLIVRFLDWHGAQTTKLIRAKKKIIALLNDQKQAIVHRAVTRGLDPDVRLKPSGAPWLDKIPEHWQMLPNRAFLKRRKLLVGESHHEFQLLSLTKKGVIVRDVESGKGKFSADMGTSQVVNVGDIIFCLFDIPETPRTVGLSHHKGMITGAYTVFSFRGPVDPRFIELFYIAMDDRKLLGPLYTGLRNTIAPSRFIGIKTPIPPFHEQIAILEAVRSDTAELDIITSKLENEISLVTEFRTRLIADVVTGKLDVRGAAVSLPETVDAEIIDDLIEDDDLIEPVDPAENEEVAA